MQISENCDTGICWPFSAGAMRCPELPGKIRCTSQPVLLKTEKDFSHRRELSGTEKDFNLLFLCYKTVPFGAFDVIMI